MRVERIELTNFRGIRQLVLEFPTQTTVLVGINGVGKSAVLDGLALLLGEFVNRFDARSFGGPHYQDKDLLNGSSEVKLSIKVRDLGTEFTWKREAKLSFSHLSWEHEQGSEAEAYAQMFKRRSSTDMYTPVPVLVYYSTERGQWSDVTHREFSSENAIVREADQLQSYKDALPTKRNPFGTFNDFYAWFREREDLENEARARDRPGFLDPQLNAVRDVVGELLQGFSDLRIERKPRRMTVKKDGRILDVAQLSAGEKALLMLVADIARRLALANPASQKPQLGAGVVLIDEVDLHLHPRWQRMVLPALERTFANCQFIVTTHSPQVLSEVKPEGIYLLERKDGETVATRPDASFGLDSNRILEDLMGVDERPRRIKEKLRDFFRLIDEGKLDEAKALRHELEEEIGSDEPNFAKADMLIRRKEMLAGAPNRPQR